MAYSGNAAGSMLSFVIAALLVLFLSNKRFQEHDRSSLPLRALKALEDRDQFPGCVVIVIVGWEQSCGSIGCFHRNPETLCNCNQRDGLRIAFSIQKLVNDRSIQAACTRAFRLGPSPFTHLHLEPLWKAHRLTHRNHFVTVPVSIGSRLAALYRQK